ncbi:hypothetical protein NDU88_001581 [Pleurodeles waltl]|uniref:Uncharacterized protein n=1 Tax=Pleurodeles waltl TaxID=8319 RepID=A0AAV7TI86_PLEWA|nr:hypothetical protein NDU88_001581 [Pleurodeles waltl]
MGRGHASQDVGRVVRELRRGLHFSNLTEPCPGAAGTADLCHAERWKRRSVPEDRPALAQAGLTRRGGPPRP